MPIGVMMVCMSFQSVHLSHRISLKLRVGGADCPQSAMPTCCPIVAYVWWRRLSSIGPVPELPTPAPVPAASSRSASTSRIGHILTYETSFRITTFRNEIQHASCQSKRTKEHRNLTIRFRWTTRNGRKGTDFSVCCWISFQTGLWHRLTCLIMPRNVQEGDGSQGMLI